MARQKNEFFLNFGLVILGIILGLCIAEGVLDLSGKIALSWQSYKDRTISQNCFLPNNGKRNFKILCVGDSSTYGRGERITYSYPYQLSQLLNQHSPSFEVSVISTGGVNSSQIANRLEKYLKTDNYNLIILQAGINDIHHFQECNIPIYTQYPHIWKWLARSKLFNLVKMSLIDRKVFSGDIDFYQPDKYGIGRFLFLDRSSLYDLFRYNFNKIISISREHNVMLWVQDYHTQGWLQPETVLYKVYAESGLEVIHQNEIFNYAQGIRMRGKDRWHPNSYGYFVIARLIYNNMVDHGIIQGQKYDLRSEIDRIKEYIQNKKEGYQFIEDSPLAYNKKNFRETLKNIVNGFDGPDRDAGKFRKNGIFDFD